MAGDISESALNIARMNASRHLFHNKIDFYQTNYLRHEVFSNCDIIVSNPPYIPSSEIETLEPEVKIYEPSLALDGGKDGLEPYRVIVPQAYSCLNPKGWLLVEIGCDQGNEVSKIFKNMGFLQVEILKDLAGLDRVVCGCKR